jgi:predicted nucleic acid-binding protein
VISDTVVDSCVVAKWVISEPDTPQAMQILTEAKGAGVRLVVLDLAFPEVTNAIWKQYHQGRITLDEARLYFDDLQRLNLHVEPARSLLKAALEIAARYRRSAYDAAFVALARHLGLKGVTADQPLYNAVHADFPEIILLRNWPPPGSP